MVSERAIVLKATVLYYCMCVVRMFSSLCLCVYWLYVCCNLKHVDLKNVRSFAHITCWFWGQIVKCDFFFLLACFNLAQFIKFLQWILLILYYILLFQRRTCYINYWGVLNLTDLLINWLSPSQGDTNQDVTSSKWAISRARHLVQHKQSIQFIHSFIHTSNAFIGFIFRLS